MDSYSKLANCKTLNYRSLQKYANLKTAQQNLYEHQEMLSAGGFVPHLPRMRNLICLFFYIVTPRRNMFFKFHPNETTIQIS